MTVIKFFFDKNKKKKNYKISELYITNLIKFKNKI